MHPRLQLDFEVSSGHSRHSRILERFPGLGCLFLVVVDSELNPRLNGTKKREGSVPII